MIYILEELVVTNLFPALIKTKNMEKGERKG